MKWIVCVLSVSAMADKALAQGGPPPGGPPFVYDLDSACDDLDDESRLSTGLIAARAVSDIVSGRADGAVAAAVDFRLTTYQYAYDGCTATEWSGQGGTQPFVELMRTWSDMFGQLSLPAVTGADLRQDALIRGHYTWVLSMLRSRLYLRRVQPVRIQLQAVLAAALQASVDCRVVEKTGGNANACEDALDGWLESIHAPFDAWTNAFGAMAETRGALIVSNTQLKSTDVTRVQQLMSASKDTRTLMDGDLWPKLLDLHTQAQSASAQRDYCWNVGYYYWSIGDYVSAYAWWAWYGYYDHALYELTTNLIPNLENFLHQLGDQAAAMDAEVVRLQDEIRRLDGEAMMNRQFLVSGIF